MHLRRVAYENGLKLLISGNEDEDGGKHSIIDQRDNIFYEVKSYSDAETNVNKRDKTKKHLTFNQEIDSFNTRYMGNLIPWMFHLDRLTHRKTGGNTWRGEVER